MIQMISDDFTIQMTVCSTAAAPRFRAALAIRFAQAVVDAPDFSICSSARTEWA